MTVTLASLGLAPLVSLPQASASDPECIPGSFAGPCTFTGSTSGGVYVYDRILIPAGVVVTATQDIVLHARQELRIEGDIVDTPSISLTSDLTATIWGTVRALDGTASDPDGGGVFVFANLADIQGTIQSGSGADGAGMVQDVQDAATAVVSVGSSGGKGGDIVVGGTSVLLRGVFILGNGGTGGSAVALGGTQSALAVGGAGGASGQLVLPAGYDLLTLADGGYIQGGDGGEATAEASSAIPPTNGEAGEPATNDKGAFFACTGAPKSGPPGAMGNSGCEGASATAYGGDGAYGLLRGGKGGNAWARGGQGGNGGRGVDGSRTTCWFFNTNQPSCPSFYGGQGGWGGAGGRAFAYGGNGGHSLIEGGRGGDATAIGGRGGNGGLGGNGGGGYIIGWSGDATQAVWAAIGCVGAFLDRAGTTTKVACIGGVLSGTTFRFVCGDPGAAGPGNWGGGGFANPGVGGKNVQGLGVAAAGGVPSSQNGSPGSNGGTGSKTPIPIVFPSEPPRVVYLCG